MKKQLKDLVSAAVLICSAIIAVPACCGTDMQAEYDFDCRRDGDFRKWQNDFRAELKVELGISRMESRFEDYRPEAFFKDSTVSGAYALEHWTLMTEPDCPLPVTVLRPEPCGNGVPLVIVAPDDNDDGMDIAVQAVNEGYLTVVPSERESRGISIGKRVWNISKVIDWAVEALPVDGTNIICTGVANGGVATIYAGAIDTRISISMPAAAFGPSRKHYPANVEDIAGLTAPRLFHAINGKEDEYISFEDASNALQDLKLIYQAAGNVDGCSMFGGDGGHQFFPKGAWRFVGMRLFPAEDSSAFKTSPFWGEGCKVLLNGKPAEVHQGPDFSYFTYHGPVPFSVSVCGLGPGDSLDVSPHVRKVRVVRRADSASFSIRERGYYIVYGPAGRKLIIFAEQSPESPAGVDVLSCEGIIADGKTNVTAALQKALDGNAGKTIVFRQGVYLVSGLMIPSGSDLFLEEGAVIRADRDSVIYDIEGTHAFIEIKQVHDVSIRGAGMIDGNGKIIKTGARNRRNVLITESSNVIIDGIVSLNPASWNTHILGCENVTLRHYKVLNDFNIWNTDGIDPDCSRNVLIENCFAHCGDDCVAVKTTDRLGKAENLKGVVVRGCVFTTNKAGLKVGTETCGASMSDILFENNVVVESWKPMYLRVEDGAELFNVTYRNNVYERCFVGPSAYDYYDGTDITPGPPSYHFVVRKRRDDSRLGSIHDVLVEGCVYETPFPSAPEIENPYGARLEVKFRNNVLFE